MIYNLYYDCYNFIKLHNILYKLGMMAGEREGVSLKFLLKIRLSIMRICGGIYYVLIL